MAATFTVPTIYVALVIYAAVLIPYSIAMWRLWRFIERKLTERVERLRDRAES